MGLFVPDYLAVITMKCIREFRIKEFRRIETYRSVQSELPFAADCLRGAR